MEVRLKNEYVFRQESGWSTSCISTDPCSDEETQRLIAEVLELQNINQLPRTYKIRSVDPRDDLECAARYWMCTFGAKWLSLYHEVDSLCSCAGTCQRPSTDVPNLD